VEQSKISSIEKPKILKRVKIEPLSKKEQVGEKLESLWGNPTVNKTAKYGTKKLVIKLATSGREKRNISLKLESSNPNVYSNNYNLISDLIKEFFNVNHNSD